MLPRSVLRPVAVAITSLVLTLSAAFAPAMAANERALFLYYTHTKETARIVFKRNGQYVRSGLKDLNYFLRDWRRNEPTQMDPRLFDLVWEVYQEVGGRQPINVVSAYRSPATNEMLRKTSSGVAENSQHTRGNAMDFFIPGVPLNKLRAVAMRKQVGGVGYYPNSGSPFVHLDTGSVRAWPRMTRAQLKQIFPDGRTMHLPSDGKPLSREGYQLALAEWKRCHAVPCTGTTRIAANGGGGDGTTTLMDVLFGDRQKPAPTAPAAAPVQVAAQAAPAAQPAPGPRIAPVPAPRPVSLLAALAPDSGPAAIPFSTTGSAPLSPEELAPEPDDTARQAPVPQVKSAALRVATAPAPNAAVTALAALSDNAPVPMPRALMPDSADILTAYLPAQTPQQDRQLERPSPEESAMGSALPPGMRAPFPAPLPVDPIQTAALGQTGAFDTLFDQTFLAAHQVEADQLAGALNRYVADRSADAAMRHPDLVPPDFDRATDMFIAPAQLETAHFAAIFDHDVADFDPTPEMGRFVTRMGPGDDTTGLDHKRFSLASLHN